MGRCGTTSGHYRCSGMAGHSGPCEAQADEYASLDNGAALRALRDAIRRVGILESQMVSVQMSLPRGIDK